MSAPALPFEYVAVLTELDESVPHAVQLGDGLRVCLVRDGGSVYAFQDRCPHRDFALSGGDIVDPCVIECPWHGARFDVRSGEVLQGPATDSLFKLHVQVENGRVYVARGMDHPSQGDDHA